MATNKSNSDFEKLVTCPINGGPPPIQRFFDKADLAEQKATQLADIYRSRADFLIRRISRLTTGERRWDHPKHFMSKRKELKAELDKLVKEFAVLQSRGKPDGVRTQLYNFVKKVGAAKKSWESAVAAKTTGTRTLKKNTAKKAMEAISDLEEAMGKRFGTVAVSDQELSEKVEDIETDLYDHMKMTVSELDELKASLGVFGERLCDVENRVRVVEDRSADMKARVEALEKLQAEPKEVVSKEEAEFVHNRVTGVNARVEELEKLRQTDSEKMTNLRQETDDTFKAMDKAFSAELAKLEGGRKPLGDILDEENCVPWASDET
mmetsp:Transcript_20399/g.38035  ORF Transcript_20399/g.38035 Transcript_20399/m.38035 type:complete len:322 (+) Transcript_20399:466-1431(+)|eukprot:CAMPEP_0182490066 /NCGR_PEP_ID=MMETSP1321-20130603/40_1 /TAXON_ID=91990 /ORGANISM="Bolidomonas sp., Strain RCC1657" /LENGTH=321 /DNA_ID=CAMNT_0024692195 /DNA_START=537 /DNA_END=1502 /DNA_ORIENTATION=+